MRRSHWVAWLVPRRSPAWSHSSPATAQAISPPPRSSPMAASCITASAYNGGGMDKHFDVIIIGSGAGGGTLARHLAPSGKSILLLERGDWLPREASNWSPADVFVENRYVSPDTWNDRDGKPFQPQVHYFVGGATKLYGA